MIALKRPTSRLLHSCAEAWRPAERLSSAEWCSQHLRLPAETSASPGRYNLQRFAYVRGVLDACDDPNIEVAVLKWATQLGKTTLLQALLAGTAATRPSPTMLATPDRDSLWELRDKFYKLCDATPALRKMIPPKHKRNDRAIDFGRCLCHLAYAGSTQRMSGKSCKVVLCTELDRWKDKLNEGAAEDIVKRRTDAFPKSLIVYESTPTDEASAIEALFVTTDQRKFQVPCPHCGHFQELVFFPHKVGPRAGRGGIQGFRHDNGEWMTPDKARAAAWYCCEAKACRIESHEKPAMIRRGVWVPKGQRVTKKGELVGTPERSSRRVGFELNCLASETFTFGRVAEDYLLARDNPQKRRSFYNNQLARIYKNKAKTPQWAEIGQRLAAHYPRGTIPAAAWFLTSGVDVQEDRCYWLVRAWGAHRTSWLIDWGVCHKRINAQGQRGTNSDLKQLDGCLLDRAWPVTGQTVDGYQELWAAKIALDTGYRIHDVHQYLRSHPGDRLRAVAGDQNVTNGFYRAAVLEKNSRTGKAYEGGLTQWQLNVNAYKEEIRDSWSIAAGDPGAWYLPQEILQVGQDYLRQICSETPTTVVNEKGFPVRNWVKVHPDNHFWDCEVYARAAADFVTEGDWDDAAPEAPTPAKDGGESFVRQPEVDKVGRWIRRAK